MPTLLKQKLRNLREEKGLSLDKLAERTGMSKSYLWELENRDKGNPSAEKIIRIAEALDVTSNFLLNDESTDPDEAVVKEAFFRKYDRLDDDTKKRIGDLVDMWSRKENETP